MHGPVSYERLIDLALYDPALGFYATGGRAGRRGDFVTSPEVGPLFGAVIANALDRWWDELGAPDPYVVVEHGAGPGTLARSVMHAAPRCGSAIEYTMVEIAAAQREQHPVGPQLRSVETADRSPHVVLANELLDNLPFGIAEHDGVGWREVLVGADGGRLVEVQGELVAGVSIDGVAGERIPLQRRAESWVGERLAELERGVVCVFDYAVSAASLRERGGGWLRTYRQQGRGGPVLEDLGAQDITADVLIDALPDPQLVEAQAVFLRRHGIDELVEAGRTLWEAKATAPDVAAIAGRSRGNEAAALCDASGLGAFAVLQWRK